MIRPHKFWTIWCAAFLACCVMIGTHLRAQVPTTGAGLGAPRGAAPSYSGPGDVTGFTTGVIAWWGLRGYNAATSGAIFNVCDNATGATCADATWSSAGGGTLTMPTIGGNACDNSTHKCEYAIFYDQSGAKSCVGAGGAPCDTSAAHGSRALVIVNCIGSKPCIAGGSSYTTGSFITSSTSAPYTLSNVAMRSSGGQAAIMSGGSNTSESLFASAANNMAMYNGGSVPTAAATDGVVHTLQFLFNSPSASSNIFVDASSNTVDTGSTNALANGQGFFFPSTANGALTGQIFEGGYWAGDKSANFSNMHTNQCTYWGTTC
jgi:hypothetical protein